MLTEREKCQKGEDLLGMLLDFRPFHSVTAKGDLRLLARIALHMEMQTALLEEIRDHLIPLRYERRSPVPSFELEPVVRTPPRPRPRPELEEFPDEWETPV